MIDLKNRMTKRNGRYATWEGIRCQELENAIESGEFVPVVHGRWVEDENENGLEADCSVCGSREVANLCAHKFGRFCPNCGAKMDLGEDKK